MAASKVSVPANAQLGIVRMETEQEVAAGCSAVAVHLCTSPEMLTGVEGASVNTVMSLLIRYAHIPFYFCFSLTFPTSPIHPYAPPLRRDCARARMTIALTLSDRSGLFDGHMTYDSHVFTSILSVSNVPLLRSDQSRGLAPRGQALSIALPYARILVYHSYLTSLYLPFIRQHHHRSPNQLPI